MQAQSGEERSAGAEQVLPPACLPLQRHEAQRGGADGHGQAKGARAAGGARDDEAGRRADGRDGRAGAQGHEGLGRGGDHGDSLALSAVSSGHGREESGEGGTALTVTSVQGQSVTTMVVGSVTV